MTEVKPKLYEIVSQIKFATVIWLLPSNKLWRM